MILHSFVLNIHFHFILFAKIYVQSVHIRPYAYIFFFKNISASFVGVLWR